MKLSYTHNSFFHPSRLSLVCFTMLAALHAVAQPIIFVDALSVQLTAEPNPVVSNTSAAIGGGNYVHGSYSAAVGSGNQLYGSQSLAVGWGNSAGGPTIGGYTGLTVGTYNSLFGNDNVNFGLMNVVEGYANLVAGDCNMIVNDETLGFIAGVSVVFGESNQATNPYSCLVSGISNQLNTATDSAAIGDGLILDPGTQSQVVVGQYSAPDIGARFIVASGTNANNPSNAFTVFANGDVIIKKRQGDILMGEFGN